MSELLTVLRELPERPERAAAQVTDWNALLDAAEPHGLAALLHHHLSAFVPAGAAARLAKAPTIATARALKLKRLVHFVVDGLADRQVPFILLKGVGLASRYWPEWYQRPSSDVDVLVSPPQTEAVAAFLRQHGFSEVVADDEATDHPHHVAFAGRLGVVEVHYRALAGPGGGSLEWAGVEPQARSGALDGREVRYLSAEDEVVYLASHAAQHLFHRVSWLYDLKLLLRAEPQLNLDRLVATAIASRLRAATHAALLLAVEQLGAPLDPSVLERLATTRAHAGLVRATFTPARLATATVASHRAAPVLRALLADSAGGVAEHLVRGAGRAVRRVVRSKMSNVVTGASRE